MKWATMAQIEGTTGMRGSRAGMIVRAAVTANTTHLYGSQTGAMRKIQTGDTEMTAPGTSARPRPETLAAGAETGTKIPAASVLILPPAGACPRAAGTEATREAAVETIAAAPHRGPPTRTDTGTAIGILMPIAGGHTLLIGAKTTTSLGGGPGGTTIQEMSGESTARRLTAPPQGLPVAPTAALHPDPGKTWGVRMRILMRGTFLMTGLLCGRQRLQLSLESPPRLKQVPKWEVEPQALPCRKW